MFSLSSTQNANKVHVHFVLRVDSFFVPQEKKSKLVLLTTLFSFVPCVAVPAPHGSTIIPLRARPLPNIRARAASWYGRIAVVALRPTARFAAPDLSGFFLGRSRVDSPYPVP